MKMAQSYLIPFKEQLERCLFIYSAMIISAVLDCLTSGIPVEKEEGIICRQLFIDHIKDQIKQEACARMIMQQVFYIDG